MFGGALLGCVWFIAAYLWKKTTGQTGPVALPALRKAAEGKDNLMPFIYDAVKGYATLGEVCDAMRAVFGIYEEVAIT